MKEQSKNSKLIILAIIVISLYSISLMPLSSASGTISLEQKGAAILSNVIGLDLSAYSMSSRTYIEDTPSSLEASQSIKYSLVSQSSNLNVSCIYTNGDLRMLQVLGNTGTPVLTKTASSSVTITAKTFLSNYQSYTSNSIYGSIASTLDTIENGKNITKTLGNYRVEVNASTSGSAYFRWTYVINGIVAPTKFMALGLNGNTFSYFVDNWQAYTIGTSTVKINSDQAQARALNVARNYSWSVPLDSNVFSPGNYNSSNVAFAALVFDYPSHTNNSLGGNSSVLYPVWRIGIHLNRWYGDIYGLEVNIRADNGEVFSAREALSAVHPENVDSSTISVTPQLITNSNSTINMQSATGAGPNYILLAWITFACTGLTITSVILTVKKKATFKLKSLAKLKGRNFGLKNLTNPIATVGLIAIILLSLFVSLSSIPSAKATTPVGHAMIWGSESAGQLPNYWRKTHYEIDIQNNLASVMGGWFSNNGWVGPNGQPIDQQGYPGSLYWNVQDQLNSVRNSGPVAVVDFDHGVGTSYYGGVFHYMFEDETGTKIGGPPPADSNAPWNAVYDKDIFTRTDPSEVIFAFISACLSADSYNVYGALNSDPYYYQSQGILPDSTARGLPFAFTHRLVANRYESWFEIADYISDDGYGNADWGSQVYIGFPKGSAALAQWIPDPQSAGYLYADWVPNFFGAMVNYHMSVHDALDYASQRLWGVPFGSSCLSQGGGGFYPYWPVWGSPDTWPKGWLAVYGNAWIQLPLPETYTLTVYAYGSDYTWDQEYGWYWEHYPVYPNVYINGFNYGPAPASAQVVAGSSPTVQLDDPAWYSITQSYQWFSGLYDDWGNYYGGNGASVPVNNNMALNAMYY